MNYILSSLIFVPLLAALIILVLPQRAVSAIKMVSLLATVLVMVLSIA